MMHGLETNFGQTPSQTVGPYFAYGLAAAQYGYDFKQPYDSVVALRHARGERIGLEGRILDGNGEAISDALVEIWQVDGEGAYPRSADDALHGGFRGIGRSGTGTDAQHRYRFDTVKPGAQSPGEAPHIDMVVTMRGLLLHVFTRVYFDDEAQQNSSDAVLKAVPLARRHTLIARRVQRGNEVTYEFDVHMQGTDETVFFDL